MCCRLQIVVSAICLMGWNSMLSANTTQEYDQDDDTTVEENTVIWVGPGLYNGIWFDNEDDFDDWHRNHYYDGHEHYHYDGHHGDHDHGEGGGGHR
ncbi:MAG: hypothetical protein KGZ39_06460 [Simkania sp.]|nr:hypothetical protein [Simkania sp.]